MTNEKHKHNLSHFFSDKGQKIRFHKDLLLQYYRTYYSNLYKEVYKGKEPIPKVIHYIWFGRGKYSEILERCQESWHKNLPGYQFKLWNEDNFPFEKYPFARQAYEKKKYAFASDVARIHALYHEGGIYLDTDMEVVKPFDPLLQYGLFTSYESPNLIQMGTIGAKQYHPLMRMMLLWYYNLDFCDTYAVLAITRIMSKIVRYHYHVKLRGKYMQLKDDIHIFTRDYFIPEWEDDSWATTENTYTIHHWTGLWKL